MPETAVVFGTNAPMVGIVSEPANRPTNENRPAVILMNSGMIHRAGPSRVSVRIARSLAKEGWTVLRFDLSGVGDSGVSDSNQSTDERSVHEVSEAMNLLERQYGISDFIVAGICSGATNALAAAGADHRVVGAVVVNPPAPDDVFGSYLMARSYWKRKLTSPSAWLRPFKGRLDYRRVFRRFVGLMGSRGQAASVGEASDQLSKLSNRGVDLLFVYSSTGSHIGRRYFKPAFERARNEASPGSLVDEVTVPASNHTFTPVVAQGGLEAVFVEWFRNLHTAESSEPVLAS